MVQTASHIIRQYDPIAKIVLFGGLNLFSGDSPNLRLDKEFAQQLANKNITKYGDAISVHAYPWMDNVEPIVWEKYTESLNYYRDLFGSVDVWVTETGQSLEAGGEKGQAQYLSEAYNFFSKENVYVSKVFWYSLIDYSDDKASFGLTENKNTRPAYQDFKKIISNA
jgi:hypothetical protein